VRIIYPLPDLAEDLGSSVRVAPGIVLLGAKVVGCILYAREEAARTLLPLASAR